MIKQSLFIFSVISIITSGHAETVDALIAEALTNNVELKFYEKQVTVLPQSTKADSPTIGQPLKFPSSSAFRRAVLNLDTSLAQLYLREFRFVLASQVRLLAIKYQAAMEINSMANRLATTTNRLIKMLEERPAAGMQAIIERQILESASLPYLREVADTNVQMKLIRTELNGLLGREIDAQLNVSSSPILPEKTPSTATTTPLLLKIREAEIVRGLAALNAASEIEDFEVGGWFTREGLGAFEAVSGITRPNSNAGTTVIQTKERFFDDAKRKLERETRQREFAAQVAREVVAAIPARVIENLQSASELAERQYRVGALDINLLIEIHRQLLDALKAYNPP
jgi:cobalt-zinc-cadmium efflux system outer membrane protein